MKLYAMALVLYGSGFVGDCSTISVGNRLLDFGAFLRSRKAGAGANMAGLIMVASILMVLFVPENGQLGEAVVE